MFLGTNGELHDALANKKHVEVPIYAGESAEVKFFHFGTSMCSGMSLEFKERLKGFLTFFKLICMPTPQMSKVMITKPVEEMAGKYNLRYGNGVIKQTQASRLSFNFKRALERVPFFVDGFDQ